MTDEINTLTEIRSAYKRAMVNASYFEMLECQKAIKALEDAESALRDRIAHQNPQPLTLDELRGMSGEPVYCVYPGCSTGGEWFLINRQGAYKNGSFLNFRYYGEWLAYRTKPEPPERAEK